MTQPCLRVSPFTGGTLAVVDQSYFDFINRLAPLVAILKQTGVWDLPHPWINLFLPVPEAQRFVASVVSTLTVDDVGQGPVLLYPANRLRALTPLFRLPDTRDFYLLALLRNAIPPTRDRINELLQANRRLFDQCVAIGGKRYPSRFGSDEQAGLAETLRTVMEFGGRVQKPFRSGQHPDSRPRHLRLKYYQPLMWGGSASARGSQPRSLAGEYYTPADSSPLTKNLRKIVSACWSLWATGLWLRLLRCRVGQAILPAAGFQPANPPIRHDLRGCSLRPRMAQNPVHKIHKFILR